LDMDSNQLYIDSNLLDIKSKERMILW